MLHCLGKGQQGIVTFEWIVLAVLLAIGLIAGLGAVRNAFTLEMADISNAASGYNASYNVQGLTFTTNSANGNIVIKSETSKYIQGTAKANVTIK